MGGRSARLAIALLALAPAAAEAHEFASKAAVTSKAVTTPCPGRAITPDRVILGEFPASLQGSNVMVPFDVPAGTTAVRVKYCFDQPELPVNQIPQAGVKHTLDLGLFGPRSDPGRPWGMGEFRGWGGSSHPDVTVSAEGFSTEAQYEASPRVEVPGKTTRAFLPGAIKPGQWAVDLGVAAVVPQSQGDVDGQVGWRVEVDFASDPVFADEPYQAAAYDTRPVKEKPDWYAGDFHVHAEHSAYGDATMTETLGFAFAPKGTNGAGLDFITLSDYVSGSAWGEIGRFAPRYPGKLIIPSAEVITYTGHANNHASGVRADYRTGPVWERRADGSMVLLRQARGTGELFDSILAARGFTQINHPTIFPSSVPGFSNQCRGCPWDYSPAATRYDKVDAIEIATGPAGLELPGVQPGPNPFTLTGIQFYDDALARGDRIAAVGSSDSHNAGRRSNPVTQAPIGQATTMVLAPELSQAGIAAGVIQGHSFVKIFGTDGPELRLEARVPGFTGDPAVMGDTIRASAPEVTARVLGLTRTTAARPGTYQLTILKDGVPTTAMPLSGDGTTVKFTGAPGSRYRLQVQRGTAIEAVSSALYVDAPPTGTGPGGGAGSFGPGPGGGAAVPTDPRLRTLPVRRLRVRGTVGPSHILRGPPFRFGCVTNGGLSPRECRVTLRLRVGRSLRVIGTGKAALRNRRSTVTVKLNAAGLRELRKSPRFGRRVTAAFVATDAGGRPSVEARRYPRIALRAAPRR